MWEAKLSDIMDYCPTAIVTGSVNHEMTTHFIQLLNNIKNHETGRDDDPLVIFFGTPGGCVSDARHCVQIIKEMQKTRPVMIIGISAVMSAGVELMLAAKYRAILDDCEVMIHNPSLESGDDRETSLSLSNKSVRLEVDYVDKLKLKLSKKQRELVKYDHDLVIENVQDLIKIGLVNTEII